MMRMLVTGAGGMIGGHLVRRLLDDGHEVRGVDVKPFNEWFQVHGEAENHPLSDLSLVDECQKAVKDIDGVFNLAADMGGMGFIENNKAACMLSVLTSTNVLSAARAAGVQRLFYSSSACVYPGYRQDTTEGVGLKESDAYPADPEDGYGWEKLFTERMCRHFMEDYGLQTRVARYHNVYGMNGSWDGGREKAPAAICRKVAVAKLSKNYTIDIWGDGEQTRSFMYTDDCIEGTLRLFNSNVPYPLNIGSDRLVTVNELVSIVETIADVKLERSYDLSAPQGVRGRNSDNSLVKKVMGWEPAITLEDGLARTYDWVEWQVRKQFNY